MTDGSEGFDAGVFQGRVLAELGQLNVRLDSIEERLIRHVGKVQKLERMSWLAIGGLAVLALTRKELLQALLALVTKQ